MNNNKKMVTLKDFIDSGMIEKGTDIIISEKYKNGTTTETTSENISDYLNHEVISISPFSPNAVCVKVKSKKDDGFIPDPDLTESKDMTIGDLKELIKYLPNNMKVPISLYKRSGNVIPKNHHYISDVKIDDKKFYEKDFTFNNKNTTGSVVGKSVEEIIKRIYLTNIKVDPSQIKLVLDFNRSYAINLYTYILDQLKMDNVINNEDKLADIISKKFKDLIVDSMNTTTKFIGTSQVEKTNYTIFINMKDNLNAINWIIDETIRTLRDMTYKTSEIEKEA